VASTPAGLQNGESQRVVRFLCLSPKLDAFAREPGRLRRGSGRRHSDRQRASLSSGVSCGTFFLAEVAVELAEQGIAVFFGPVGQLLDEGFHLFAGGIAKRLDATEVGGVGLDQVGIELTLADELAKAVANFRAAVVSVAIGSEEENPSEEKNQQSEGKGRQSEELVERLRSEEVACLLTVLDNRLKWLSELARDVTECEDLAVDAEARSFTLPPADATDKLTRYEAHMDRQLYRATDQLDRLKRQRRGETTASPQHQSGKGKIGFLPNKAKKCFVFNDSDPERFCKGNCVLTSTLPRASLED
jgi:hypothetical protein